MRIIVVKEDMAGDRQTCFHKVYKSSREARLDIIDDFYDNFDGRQENHNIETCYSENKTQYCFVSTETGEIFAEYFMLYVWF